MQRYDAGVIIWGQTGGAGNIPQQPGRVGAGRAGDGGRGGRPGGKRGRNGEQDREKQGSAHEHAVRGDRLAEHYSSFRINRFQGSMGKCFP